MRKVLLASSLCLVWLAGTSAAFAQEWKEFRSQQDGFGVNFPGDPVVTEIRWISEYGADVPARVYTGKDGLSTYAVTVVDYNLVKKALIENAKTCRERCPAADSYSGEGHWKDDVRGAMVYAEFKMLQRDAKLTYFHWNYLGIGIESNQLQFINNVDKSRTFANLYMHENRLYILEATSPPNGLLPNIFTESIAIPAAHEGVYFNRARVDPSEKMVITRTNPSVPAPEGGGWREYTNRGDLFTVNFPGRPVVTDVPWRTEYGSYLPAYSYTAKQGASTYSVTVVNYNWVQALSKARVEERCVQDVNDERCTGDTSWSGIGYWKNDLRGAMIFAQSKFLQRDGKVTRFKWNYLPQGIESNELEVVNADTSRTSVVTAIHLNRLYIVEATTPADQPVPTFFAGSLSLLNVEGIRAFHEGVYVNGTRVDPNEINARLTGFAVGLPQGPPALAGGAR